MSKFNIAEAKANFSRLVRKAMLGEEVIIAKDNKPVLRLVPLDQPKRPREPGSGKGQILYIAPDFDATPKGFDDYV
ncbi:MAG: prevent-host-death protein [Betaproteobacteria bacterium RIFCSPLOWO2_12_FULL_68_19]|nr:MAG: prevent-host-death protein [Betaproteobacteria bacterium RIFCSPLOWO2_12_FULL_68_19]